MGVSLLIPVGNGWTMIQNCFEVMENDVDTTDNYNRNGGAGDNADPISAFPAFPGRETHTQVHTVSRKSIAFCGIRTAGGLLPEKCQSAFGQSWNTGIYFNRDSSGTALVEEADADIHSGRHCLLYAAGAVRILKMVPVSGQ